MIASQSTSNRRPVLGCIADDVTGATDLAINLVQGGMKVVQVLGVPTPEQLKGIDSDAVVVALKSRSIPSEQAIKLSLDSLASMQSLGIERIFFKYCSTFDSTPEGNIGPVAEALMNALSVPQTIFCPAFPRNGRSVYQGHLFVGDRLLNESGMQDHPLNPMTDSDLARVLSQQCRVPVGKLTFQDYSGDLSEKLSQLCDSNAPFVITDACDDFHLQQLSDAVCEMQLVTGGSGIGRYLPEAYRRSGLLTSESFSPSLPPMDGRGLIVAGSCSRATQQQVEWMRSRSAARAIDIADLMKDAKQLQSDLVEWAVGTPEEQPVMLYSTATPEQVGSWQKEFGVAVLAEAIEDLLSEVTHELVQTHDFRKLVLAGGETSGAIVKRLEIESLEIGPEICAGVPWTVSSGPRPLCLALKSGNFGDVEFFDSALRMLA